MSNKILNTIKKSAAIANLAKFANAHLWVATVA